MFKKISKSIAKKLYEGNQEIWLAPNKLNVNVINVWYAPLSITKEEVYNNSAGVRTFEDIVNEYRYYNCNSTVGNIVSFYRKVESYE